MPESTLSSTITEWANLSPPLDNPVSYGLEFIQALQSSVFGAKQILEDKFDGGFMFGNRGVCYHCILSCAGVFDAGSIDSDPFHQAFGQERFRLTCRKAGT